MKYFDYTISYKPKPIPTHKFDYDFVHDDYDGAADSNDDRFGNAASIEDAIEQIDCKYREAVFDRADTIVENVTSEGVALTSELEFWSVAKACEELGIVKK